MYGIHAPFRVQIFLTALAVGREFAFPIDFSASMHQELISSPTTVDNLSKHLAACCKIAMLLVSEHRA